MAIPQLTPQRTTLKSKPLPTPARMTNERLRVVCATHACLHCGNTTHCCRHTQEETVADISDEEAAAESYAAGIMPNIDNIVLPEEIITNSCWIETYDLLLVRSTYSLQHRATPQPTCQLSATPILPTDRENTKKILLIVRVQANAIARCVYCSGSTAPSSANANKYNSAWSKTNLIDWRQQLLLEQVLL